MSLDRWPRVVLSGNVCAGKTTLAEALAAHKLRRVSTRQLLLAVAPAGTANTRPALQRLGEELDRHEGGRWVVRALTGIAATQPVVVDAVRTLEQVEALAPSLHCHLWAPREILRGRYETRRREDPDFEAEEFDEVMDDATERQVQSLSQHADIALDTSRLEPERTAQIVVAQLQEGRS